MQAGLKHHSEFTKVLAAYQVSDRAHRVLKELKLVLMLAPSSSGRNTIIRHQVQSGKYHFIVSDTTRSPRINDGILEQDGQEYWFRSEEDILADLEAGEFLEAEIIHNQQVSGISVRELEKARDEHKIAITDMDLVGVHNVMRVKPDSKAIMLLPPSFEEWQRRLASRGIMSPDEQRRRLETALKILQDGLKESYYQFVIAEDVRQSGAIIDAIVEGKPNPHQGRGPGVIAQLEGRLQDALS